MTTRIGLISDPHAAAAPVEQALSLFAAENVDRVYCLGDIAGYGNETEQTVSLLQNYNCQSIMGNHEQWYLQKATGQQDQLGQYFSSLPLVIDTRIEDTSLYFVHASPPDSVMDGIRLLDEQGQLLGQEVEDWRDRLAGFAHDVLIVGHTHQVFAEKIGNTLVINPGSTVYNNSCAILTLPDMEVQWVSLSGKQIISAWNWGMDVVRMNKVKNKDG